MANCLPTYLPLMYQLRLLLPSRQVEVVMLVASQPVLMAALALAAPSTHQAVHSIATLGVFTKVRVRVTIWMIHTHLLGFVMRNTNVSDQYLCCFLCKLLVLL